MKILAISVKGQEFLYNPKTARKVSVRSAETIKRIANERGYLLKANETWYAHDIDRYDEAYLYALCQKFTIRNGIVKDWTV